MFQNFEVSSLFEPAVVSSVIRFSLSPMEMCTVH
jgi:hypothetical protein